MVPRMAALGGLVAAIASASALPTSTTSSTPSRCKEVNFQVSGSATNFDFSGVNIGDLSALLLQLQGDFPPIPVSGSQILAGTYCGPTCENANNDKLQILIGTITDNRNPWSATGDIALNYTAYEPETYSYSDYMNAKGYPTLALDRLGTGKSSHPDPFVVVQGPYENALYHDLFTQIRSGTTGALPRSYSHLIYVGNSFGSSQGAYNAKQYSQDIDQYVLTGFSKQNIRSVPGIVVGTVPVPAALGQPTRFGTLSPGYFLTSNEQGRTATFFGSPSQVDFDPQAAHLFYERQDVVSAGDFISTFIGPVEAPNYEGRVLVLTGEQDQIFCGFGNPNFGQAACGDLLKETSTLFPAADYNYKSIAKTGHAVQLHRSAPRTYDIAARFLAGEKFAGGAPA